MRVVVASKNPVKIEATRAGFKRMFPEEKFEIESVFVSSLVSGQPKTDSETYLGASNRANGACETILDADFYVGLEGGIEERGGEMECFAWAVIKSKDGKIGKGRTGTFFLPVRIAQLIREGKELGEADDIVFERKNSKESNGAVGILTRDVIDRMRFYSDAVVLALIPFKNKGLY